MSLLLSQGRGPESESDSAASADKSGKVRSPDTATGATLTDSPFSEKKEESDSEGRSPGTGVKLKLEGVLDDAQTKSLDDAKKEILDKFFDADGNYKYMYFIEDDESDSDSDSKKESEAGQTGGVEPEQGAKYQRIRTAYYKSLSDDDKKALLGNDLGADVAETIQLILSPPPPSKHLAMLGLERKHWEVPNPTQQCITAGIPPGRPCWLCGNPVNMGYGGAIVKGKRMSVCSPDDNQYECEHVLPGAFMLFLKKMINITLGADGARDAREARLYDSSCHICNTTKSDGVYIKAYWSGAAGAGRSLMFSPHNEKIMVDILTFILSTRIGQTVELNRYKEDEVSGSSSSAGRSSMAARLAAREAALQTAIREDHDKKPICSNRDAVVSYINSMSSGERVITRSSFTSITTVADPVNQDTVKAIADALPPSIVGEVRNTAAKSAETAVAFTTAPRFNNLTRAVIEQITPADIAAAGAIPFPPKTHIRMDMFNFLTTELDGKDMGEKGTFYRVFNVPDPVVSIVPGAAAPEPPADLAPASGPPAVAAPSRMSSETRDISQNRLSALDAAGIPKSVDREKAWAWIRTRYMEIWTRMNELCGILNREHERIEGSVRSLAEQPLLTSENIDTLEAWSQVREPAGAPAESVGTKKRRRGGMSFTVHRRSETRQTKKNRRMRKPRVIEVNV